MAAGTGLGLLNVLRSPLQLASKAVRMSSCQAGLITQHWAKTYPVLCCRSRACWAPALGTSRTLRRMVRGVSPALMTAQADLLSVVLSRRWSYPSEGHSDCSGPPS
jgi:hypothetical protein